MIPLREIAFARSGDKGNSANIAVFARTPAAYAWLRDHLTAARVEEFFRPLGVSRATRFEVPNLHALNFVLADILGGGASRSLRIDAQGKALGMALLEMPIEADAIARPDTAPMTTGPTSTPPLLTSTTGAITTVTLNRPGKRNALDTALLERLCTALDVATADASQRLLVLRGAGPVFCSGLDLAEAADERHATRAAELLSRALRTLATTRLVTIAFVHGAALAGGAGLVSACDFALATRDAKFGFPEVHRGLVPALILTFLRRQLRQRDASELLLLGNTFAAGHAHAIGLVNRVADDLGALERELEAIAATLLQAAPNALASTKRFLRELWPAALERDLDVAHALHLSARRSAEAAEGIAAFNARRPPRWPGPAADNP